MATPRPDFDQLLRDTLGDLLLRPWFDRVAVEVLSRWFFPLSRAWAAARAAEGSAEAFADALGMADAPRWLIDTPVARMAALESAHRAADAAWEAALFAAKPPPMADRVAAETARVDATHALMMGRRLFTPLHMARRLPPVALNMAAPDAVATAHGNRLVSPAMAFTPPGDVTDWTVSAPLERSDATHRWLRRVAPRPYPDSPDDRLRARVMTPPGAAADSPTLVFAHGIGMEEEFWRGTAEPLRLLGAESLRLVRAEAPWHSHRMARGQYGGEPVLGRGVLGLLDFMHGAVMELGLLIAWARHSSGGAPVAVGGVSLGALTAQLVATTARHWPPEMRPDAVFLVTPSASLTAVAFDGALTGALGVPQALSKAGWTRAAVEAWRPLLEPQGPPVCPADRVILVLGEEDTVTPYAEGQALAKTWGVPADGVFTRPRGHFTSSLGLGLGGDAAPFRRLATVLRESPSGR